MEVDADTATRLLAKAAGRLLDLPCFYPEYILIDSKRDVRLQPTFFYYEEGGEVFYHGFQLSKIPKTEYYDIQSAYGYGGPIATSTEKDFLENAWKEYYEFCCEKKVIVEFIRFHPLYENWKFYQGEVINNRKTVLVDLQAEDLISSYAENRVRTAIRKGLKNCLSISIADNVDFMMHFKDLYLDSMLRIGAPSFYLFNEDYLKALCSWKKSFLVLASKDNKKVAALLGLISGKILELHLFGSSAESNRLCATNLIYHEAFKVAKEMGCHIAHFGGGVSNSKDDRLLFFKLGYSSNTLDYKIGKFIHNPDVYYAMKKSFECNTDKKTNKILFYTV